MVHLGANPPREIGMNRENQLRPIPILKNTTSDADSGTAHDTCLLKILLESDSLVSRSVEYASVERCDFHRSTE